MAISGSLRTMPLSEVLQWASHNKRTGILRITQNRSTLSFVLQDGRISGCGSDDPPMLLGQFLLSRGKIDERQLQDALAEQENSNRALGLILADKGWISSDELNRYVRAKAEETVFKLFEWADADFRFEPDAAPGPHIIPIQIDVEELLLRKANLEDELERMRNAFPHKGVVLAHTEHRLNQETARSPVANRIYELIDGRRNLAEILLQSRAAEILTLRFLFQLFRRGIIHVADVNEVAPEHGTPDAACDLARGLAERGEHEAALDTLQNTIVAHPGDERLKRMLVKLEAAYLEKAYESDLAPGKKPVLVDPPPAQDELGPLNTNELFLLDSVKGGDWEVRSLVRISPLHEIDVVRGLMALLRRGLIELNGGADPETVELPDFPAEEMARELGAIAEELDRTLSGIMSVDEAGANESGEVPAGSEADAPESSGAEPGADAGGEEPLFGSDPESDPAPAEQPDPFRHD